MIEPYEAATDGHLKPPNTSSSGGTFFIIWTRPTASIIRFVVCAAENFVTNFLLEHVYIQIFPFVIVVVGSQWCLGRGLRKDI